MFLPFSTGGIQTGAFWGSYQRNPQLFHLNSCLHLKMRLCYYPATDIENQNPCPTGYLKGSQRDKGSNTFLLVLVVPEPCNPPEGITINGYAANRRERQVSGDEQLAAGRRFAQQAHPHVN